MSRYRHHKYTWSRPFGSTRHNWSLIGPDGAINFHATVTPSYGASCGLEIHRISPVGHQVGDAPSHLDCELTGGRCWHDGTSLYAQEQVWPYVESYLRTGDHDAIFRYLESEANSQFGYAELNESEAA